MFSKIINGILFIFLIVLPPYLTYSLYHLDKVYFFCPIEYRKDTIIIRHDSYGRGEFMADRNGGRKHNGIDLQAKVGAPVYAARAGQVMEARFNKGMGNYVEIRHNNHYTTIYGHLSQIGVKENQFVCQGQKIGEVGKTGNANFRGLIPHLHLEVRLNDVPLDPMEFLE